MGIYENLKKVDATQTIQTNIQKISDDAYGIFCPKFACFTTDPHD